MTTPMANFPKVFNGLLFRSSLYMSMQSLKFIALPIPEMIGCSLKNWTVTGYIHAPFSGKFLMGFCLDGLCECTCQI